MHGFEAQRAKIAEQPAPRLADGIFSPNFGVAIVEKDDIRMEKRRQPVGVFRFKARALMICRSAKASAVTGGRRPARAPRITRASAPARSKT